MLSKDKEISFYAEFLNIKKGMISLGAKGFHDDDKVCLDLPSPEGNSVENTFEIMHVPIKNGEFRAILQLSNTERDETIVIISRNGKIAASIAIPHKIGTFFSTSK